MKKHEKTTTPKKKLQLHRETLQSLEPRELEDVFGAMPCNQGNDSSFPSVCFC